MHDNINFKNNLIIWIYSNLIWA